QSFDIRAAIDDIKVHSCFALNAPRKYYHIKRRKMLKKKNYIISFLLNTKTFLIDDYLILKIKLNNGVPDLILHTIGKFRTFYCNFISMSFHSKCQIISIFWTFFFTLIYFNLKELYFGADKQTNK
ncbi:hypothetical protein BpHYR1_038646, partial [Brachionus plicatilis]